MLASNQIDLDASWTTRIPDSLAQWTKSHPTMASGNTVPRIKQMTFEVI
jgi:hypothetical protein